MTDVEIAQHNEDQAIEDAALAEGFGDTDFVPETTAATDEPAHGDDQVAQQEQQEQQAADDAVIKQQQADPQLTRAEFQALTERANALEEMVRKQHDRTAGKFGELQQKIEQVRSAGRGLSPKVRESLEAEFPELAAIFSAGDDISGVQDVAPVVQPPLQNVDELVESKLQARLEDERKAQEKRLLKFAHKDWETVVAGDDFNGWLATRPPTEQAEFRSSWDADFIADKLTAFKGWKAEQDVVKLAADKKSQDKKQRLEAALQVRGTPRGGSGYNDDDEEAAMERAFSG